MNIFQFKFHSAVLFQVKSLSKFLSRAGRAGIVSAYPGKYYRKGRLGTDDLLVLTSLYQLLSILKILFAYFTKQKPLMRRSIVLSLFP
jgi:hypothetical protein